MVAGVVAEIIVDLLESVENPSFWKKIVLGFQLLRYNFQLRQRNLKAAA